MYPALLYILCVFYLIRLNRKRFLFSVSCTTYPIDVKSQQILISSLFIATTPDKLFVSHFFTVNLPYNSLKEASGQKISNFGSCVVGHYSLVKATCEPLEVSRCYIFEEKGPSLPTVVFPQIRLRRVNRYESMVQRQSQYKLGKARTRRTEKSI